MTKQTLIILAPFFIATLLYFLGAPDGLNPNAWLYFCIFMGVYFWRGVFDRVFKRVRALGQTHRL
ncbi:hypothetical protein UBN68_03070 [Helicobacter pylori]